MPKGQNAANRDRRQAPPRTDEDRTFVVRFVRNGFGVLMLLAGIAGLVLPILQGWLMILIGLSLIDLPIKHRAHVYLLRLRWYRWIARKHDAAWVQWHDYRKRRRARERAATSRQR
jgi:hypothetical protein